MNVFNVTGDVVSGLKANPALLALVIINVMFLASIVWVLHEVRESRQEDRAVQTKLVDKINEVVLACRGYRLQSDEPGDKQ